jgi:cell division protein FtsB
MLDATLITELQRQATAHWHDAAQPLEAGRSVFEKLVLEHHRANFDLWHSEDSARDPHATNAQIVAAKRAIDKLNQQRNDLAERIDLALLEAAAQEPTAPLHSESPGFMIDRLSILALKIFHTDEEIHRKDAGPAHQERNRERLAQLTEQRDDLAACLCQLWTEVLAGRRRFKIYRQLKMYNDPTLNPVLYGRPPQT